LLGKAALVRGARAASTSGSVERPTPDGATVVLSFVCNRSSAERVAATVETAVGRLPAMTIKRGEASAAAVGGPE
jgi:hypothetical protein